MESENKWKPDERRFRGLGDEKTWQVDTQFLWKKSLISNGTEFENDARLISGVAPNDKTKEPCINPS